MMTSMLADKSVIVKIKIIMNFNFDINNPTCNSLLATFFEFKSGVSPEKASFSLGKLVRPMRTISQLFKLLFPFPLLLFPKKNVLERERRGESCGRSRRTNWSRRCVRERGGLWGRCGGLTWGRWCCWWRWRGWGLWIRVWGTHALRDPSSKETGEEESVRGVVDTAELPQCEFSNLHQ